MNPLTNNPLRTRADMQDAVRDLVAPLLPHFSAGGARVPLGDTGATFDNTAAQLEGFARPLWGLAPLAAGGGDFAHWDLYRRGFANGSNPHHGEYWGCPRPRDQRLVEMAAFGLALAIAPQQVWEPLAPSEQETLAKWLYSINEVEIVENNWLFFRVLVNLGLAHVDAPHDFTAMHTALDRLESYYLGNGWYHDGPGRPSDYYIPFAFHFYGLIYARLATGIDPRRCERFRQRGGEFARDFIHWFAADGSALAYGRSLTYRFAQGGFWGALAYADVDALPWGMVKGLTMRHLRWWAQQSIFSGDGLLTIGYAYPNLNMSEQYNSPGSPYWAMKYFLPLALEESHPFWQAEEAELPQLPALHKQPPTGMLLQRHDGGRHVIALCAGQKGEGWMRHGGEKYAKFAYSTAFGFSVPLSQRQLERCAADSMLALSDDGEHYRVREMPLETRVEEEYVWSRWSPMPEVEVETWILPAGAWHLRLHHLTTRRTIWSAEAGFALDRTGDDPVRESGIHKELGDRASARYPSGGTGIANLVGERTASILRADPNTNLLTQRTVIPQLTAQHAPGEHWLACAVFAEPNAAAFAAGWENIPALPAWLTEMLP